MSKPTFIFHPAPLYCDPVYYSQEPVAPMWAIDLNAYWLWSLNKIEDGDSRVASDPTQTVDPLKLQLSKHKKRNKAIFKPMIIERSDKAMEKLLDEIDKDALIFK